jgi:hypothetical protein
LQFQAGDVAGHWRDSANVYPLKECSRCGLFEAQGFHLNDMPATPSCSDIVAGPLPLKPWPEATQDHVILCQALNAKRWTIDGRCLSTRSNAVPLPKKFSPDSIHFSCPIFPAVDRVNTSGCPPFKVFHYFCVLHPCSLMIDLDPRLTIAPSSPNAL